MKKNLLKINILLIAVFSSVLISCAVQKSTVTGISADYATQIMKSEVGTTAPQRKLYHTYEENYSGSNYNSDFNVHNTLSFSKIEGNYIEGVWIHSWNGSNETIPVFGRYDFNKLYLYTQGTPTYDVSRSSPISSALITQEVFVFQIGQNGRMLTRLKYAYSIVNGVLKWHEEPPYNVDLDERKKYVLKYSSSGFISKTDDYIGEEGKSTTPASQTLTEKLQELKNLLDQNIITQDEYDNARKKLLEK